MVSFAMIFGAVDAGASVNACAVAAIARDATGLWCPIYLAEEQGRRGNPLDVRHVLVPHAAALRALGCESWASDGWAHHDVHHAGIEAGIGTHVVGGTLWEQWRHVMAVAARDRLGLAPHDRLPREHWPMLERLADQLVTVREKFANGQRTIDIPEVGTSHGDLATAFARAFLWARAADQEPDEARRPRRFEAAEYGSASRYAPAMRGR